MFSKFFSLEQEDSALELWLEQKFGAEKFKSDGQDRLVKHFSKFKDSFSSKGIPIIIIGGTNGKGETALYLEKLCDQYGICSFLWSSPHILSVRERICRSGRPISVENLEVIFRQLENDAAELSYYEFLFKCFCEYVEVSWKKGSSSVIILEVGLGGRLDATNFFDSDISALTSVSRDHTALLGDTHEEILQEKIVISRSGKPLFSAVSQGFLKERILKFTQENNVELFDVDASIGKDLSFHKRNSELANTIFKYLLESSFSQVYNAKLSDTSSVWARPLRVTYKGSQFILIGSHNLDGLRHLARWAFIAQSSVSGNSFEFDKAFFGFSRHEEAELVDCLRIIGKSPCLGKKRLVFAFDHQRATPFDLLDRAFSKLKDKDLVGLSLENGFQDVIEEFDRSQLVLVSGSYYFISSFIRNIYQHPSFKFC